MAETTATRRLTAIVAADVAGYSRLISVDEEGTLAALRAHRKELIDPKITEYRGRIANTAGDSLLIEFPSVVEALRCIIDIQRGIDERNADIPEDRRIVFRAGVNLGDVIDQDGDLLGDGVNVAARLEGIAESGGINISAAAFDQVQDRVDVGYEDLGEKSLKNIPKPVRVYRVLLDESGAGPVVKARSKLPLVAAVVLVAVVCIGLWWTQSGTEPTKPNESKEIATVQTDRVSVAVLPFDNMSGDKEQEYFSDGMSEDLITDLSKISGLDVVARNSSFAYKGQSFDIRDIGRDLNVKFVVEGSVRKAGGHVRINAQLIDTSTGNHVWADRFDREYKDVFALQDEVVARIVEALKVKLTPKDQQRLAKHETDNPEAYDWYLKGLQQESFFSKEGNAESRRMFHRAIELDPGFSAAYASLAQAYSLANENGWIDDDQKEEFANKALSFGKKAVALDPDSPRAHWSLGRVATRPPFRDMELALASLKRTTELDPNYGDGYAFYANILNYVGRAEEAIPMLKKAMVINPRYPFWYVYLIGQAQYLLKDFEASIPNFKTAIERNPNVSWPHRWLAAAYGQLGLIDDAEWELSELESMGQVPTLKTVTERTPMVHQPYIELYVDGLRKAGVPKE